MHNTVSIITPTKNSAATIDRLIDSYIDYLHLFREIIFVDFQSRDGTLEVVSGRLGSFPGLKLIRTDIPGIFRAFNIGLASATSDYVIFQNSDDRFLSHSIPSAVNLIRRSTSALITFSVLREGRVLIPRFLGIVGILPSLDYALIVHGGGCAFRRIDHLQYLYPNLEWTADCVVFRMMLADGCSLEHSSIVLSQFYPGGHSGDISILEKSLWEAIGNLYSRDHGCLVVAKFFVNISIKLLIRFRCGLRNLWVTRV